MRKAPPPPSAPPVVRPKIDLDMDVILDDADDLLIISPDAEVAVSEGLPSDKQDEVWLPWPPFCPLVHMLS